MPGGHGGGTIIFTCVMVRYVSQQWIGLILYRVFRTSSALNALGGEAQSTRGWYSQQELRRGSYLSSCFLSPLIDLGVRRP